LLGFTITAMAADSTAITRDERIKMRERNPKWRNDPVRIEMLECINCDACLRACPPNFPELCSGCDKCIPACPVDCIYPDPDWTPETATSSGSGDWWELPRSDGDPYV
jgi:electron transport complex protein RnfB